MRSLRSRHSRRFIPCALFRLPKSEDIDRRIEAANALEHTPLLAQTDRPAGQGDGFTQALWREHQKRMAEKLAGVGGDLPRTGVPERDPWALRAVAALLLVVAFAFSFGPQGGSLRDGFRQRHSAEALPPRIDAWVTPPAYTGKAPIFLTAENNAATKVFTVPAGSDVALRVTGGSGEEQLVFAEEGGATRDIPAVGEKPVAKDAKVEAPKPTAGPAAARQFAGKLTGNGDARVARRRRRISSAGPSL